MAPLHVPVIGGPGTRLPRAVEAFLSWQLAFFCLSVSGYHYIVGTLLKPLIKQVLWLLGVAPSEEKGSLAGSLPCWIPLTTHSRYELAKSPQKRYQQFLELLRIHVSASVDGNIKENDDFKLSDDDLVDLVRSHETLRRLASLAMRPKPTTDQAALGPSNTASLDQQLQQRQQLARIWPRLLKLPPCDKPSEFRFAVSLVVPVYREQGSEVRRKLQHACEKSRYPNQIQVIIVDAGQCQDMDKARLSADSSWGEVKLVSSPTQAGRGPSLNCGATHAEGRIFAFCHSDARLPTDWDAKLMDMFAAPDPTDANTVRVNSCAFGFKIDDRSVATVQPHHGRLPPGIRAVEVTANLRCRLWTLPYGDQCICVPSNIFNYIGGFPHQCLMEDYEFVAHMRKRVSLIPRLVQGQDSDTVVEREALKIVPGEPALCSPRRWQQFGVLYVTYSNSKLVNLYEGGAMPREIYERYYGHSLDEQTQISPWETLLNKNDSERRISHNQS